MSIRPKMTAAAIYIRKSREDKDRPAHRLTVQREQLPAYALAQGWTPIIYDDGHASAAKGKTDDLRERGRMESDLRAGKIHVILCIELSRLSRDDTLEDYLSWLNLCADHGVRLATMSRILDPRQHSDWMLLLMEGGFSSVEMKIIRERMAEGRAQAFRAGKWLGGNLPWPYRLDNGRPVIDDHQLGVVRRIFDLAQRHSARQVGEMMGLPAIKIRRMIADERLLFYQGLRRDPDTGAAIQGEWPAIIDAAEAAAIRAGRRSGTSGSGYHRRAAAGLLTNLNRLVVCGYCGRAIRAWTNPRKKRGQRGEDYYSCSSKDTKGRCPRSRMIQQPLLDDRVLTNLFGTLDRLHEIARYWGRTQDDVRAQIVTLTDQERALLQKRDRLVHAIAEGVIELADAKTQRAALAAQIDDLRRQQARLLDSIEAPPDWDAIQISRDEFEAFSFDDQRTLITAAIAEIRLYHAYAQITYRFPRTADGDRHTRIHLPPPEPRNGHRSTSRNNLIILEKNDY